MAVKKRYIATVSFFVYADSDEEAKRICRTIEDKERKLFDNQYDIESLEEHPFASFKSRKVNL